MKVLHVLDHSLPIGSGYSYRSRSIQLAQRALGLEAVVLTSPKQAGTGPEPELIHGIRHYRTPVGGVRLPLIRELALMWRLAARIRHVARRERVDVIHAYSPLLNGLPALWAARRLGLRVVYEVRTLWEDAAVTNGTFVEGSARYRLSRALETFLMRRVDRVAVICEGIRREVVSRGVPERRIAVVPNGVDPDWFEAQPRATALAARLGLGAGPIFAYVGSFSEYEGLPFLVEAAPDFLRGFPDGKLLLVGGGRDDEAVRRAVAVAGPQVALLGRLPQAQVRELYTLLDVLVLPRRRARLTELVTPLKPLEAMAMSKAVLASDVGGHAELIRDGETGLLFHAESREALIAQAVRLGECPGLRRRLGEAGRRYVTDHRRWDCIAKGYLPVYAMEGA